MAAEPPDWNAVDRLAGELSARSKDLRIAILGARAGLALRGFGGLREWLEGLALYVEGFWPQIHPQPDAEDGDDQTMRLNALASLCDHEGLLQELRAQPLTRSRVFGRFSLGDWQEAQRAASAGAEAAGPNLADINSSFLDTERAELDRGSADLAAILAAAQRIRAGVSAQTGGAESINLSPLTDLLQQMQRLVDEHRPALAAETAPAPGEAAVAPGASLEIRDRNDVIGMLDRICRWYRINEPASPVPPILERVRQLVSKDFLALLLEVAPDGAPQFRALAGLTVEGERRGV